VVQTGGSDCPREITYSARRIFDLKCEANVIGKRWSPENQSQHTNKTRNLLRAR
jgi:hypothetical protein